MPDHFFVLYIQNGDFLVGERKRRRREIPGGPGEKLFAGLIDFLPLGKAKMSLVLSSGRNGKQKTNKQTNKQLQKKRLEGVEQ